MKYSRSLTKRVSGDGISLKRTVSTPRVDVKEERESKKREARRLRVDLLRKSLFNIIKMSGIKGELLWNIISLDRREIAKRADTLSRTDERWTRSWSVNYDGNLQNFSRAWNIASSKGGFAIHSTRDQYVLQLYDPYLLIQYLLKLRAINARAVRARMCGNQFVNYSQTALDNFLWPITGNICNSAFAMQRGREGAHILAKFIK